MRSRLEPKCVHTSVVNANRTWAITHHAEHTDSMREKEICELVTIKIVKTELQLVVAL